MNSLHWVVLAIVGIATSAVLGSNVGIGFAGACLCALIFGLMTSRNVEAKLSVTREADASFVEAGSSITVRVRARAEGTFRLRWVLLKDTAPEGALLEGSTGMLAIGSRTLDADYFYKLQLPERGVFPLGPAEAVHGDILSLRTAVTQVPGEDEVVVHPRIHSLPEFHLASSRPLGDRRSDPRSYEDPTRPAGVRAYQSGDPMKRIHWKASARAGNLMSKVYDGSSNPLYVFLPDRFAGNYTGKEHLELGFTFTASALALLCRTGVEVGLHTAGYLKPDEGTLHLEKCLRALAEVVPDGTPLSEQILSARLVLPWRCTLVLVTGNLDAEAAAALDLLAKAGCSLAVVLVGDRFYTEGSLARAASLGASVARIETEGDIRHVRFISATR